MYFCHHSGLFYLICLLLMGFSVYFLFLLLHLYNIEFSLGNVPICYIPHMFTGFIFFYYYFFLDNLFVSQQ